MMLPLISKDKRLSLTPLRAWTGVIFLFTWLIVSQGAFSGDNGSSVPFQILFSGDTGGEISPRRL